MHESEIEIDHQQEKEASILKSFTLAGIPKEFHAKSESLSKHGWLGEKIFEEVNSGELLRRLSEGEGYYFEGDQPEMRAIYSLTCRAALLSHLSVRSFSLPTFLKIISDTGGYDEIWREILSARVIALSGFFDPSIKPLTHAEIWRIEWTIRDLSDCGAAFILHANGPLALADWWTTAFRSFLIARMHCYALTGERSS